MKSKKNNVGVGVVSEATPTPALTSIPANFVNYVQLTDPNDPVQLDAFQRALKLGKYNPRYVASSNDSTSLSDSQSVSQPISKGA